MVVRLKSKRNTKTIVGSVYWMMLPTWPVSTTSKTEHAKQIRRGKLDHNIDVTCYSSTTFTRTVIAIIVTSKNTKFLINHESQ